MDKYSYINIEVGNSDKKKPAVIRYQAVVFGRGVESAIFDRWCRPRAPLTPFIEKFLCITNQELEKYPPEEQVKQEFLRFIQGSHIICDNIPFCEKVLSMRLVDCRSTADVKRANGIGYFDEKYRDVLKQAQEGNLTLADIQRTAQCGYSDACRIADDLVFHNFLIKSDRIYILNEAPPQIFTKGDKIF